MDPDPSQLGPAQRRARPRARRSSETFDLVVIGGGVVGAGTALDAASRGLSVALIEQRDWASGTSSRSSKLIHGGLRYLEQLDFGLVREALSEQTLLLERLCPHLVKPVPFLYPLTHRDLGTPLHRGGHAPLRHCSPAAAPSRAIAISPAAACSERFPGLRGDKHDRRHPVLGRAGRRRAAHDDPRSDGAGARRGALSSVRAEGFVDVGRAGRGRRRRAASRPGPTLEIRGRQVVNATGVWTDLGPEARRPRARARARLEGHPPRRAPRPHPRRRRDSSCAPRRASSS